MHDSPHHDYLLFYRDTFIISLANSATSIVAGFVIFSAIGYMAHIHNLPVDDIATDGKCFFLFIFFGFISFCCCKTSPPMSLCFSRFVHKH